MALMPQPAPEKEAWDGERCLLVTTEQDSTPLAEEEAILNRVQSLPVALHHWLSLKRKQGRHSLKYCTKSRSADI
jgi:hypothetical protein